MNESSTIARVLTLALQKPAAPSKVVVRPPASAHPDALRWLAGQSWESFAASAAEGDTFVLDGTTITRLSGANYGLSIPLPRS